MIKIFNLNIKKIIILCKLIADVIKINNLMIFSVEKLIL